MSKSEATAPAASAATITLETPVVRGEQSIASVQLRKPKAGDLRGLALAQLLQLDVATLQQLLPRISEPTLTTADVGNMDPHDLLSFGTAVAGFFLSAKDRASLPA